MWCCFPSTSVKYQENKPERKVLELSECMFRCHLLGIRQFLSDQKLTWSVEGDGAMVDPY